MKNSIFSFTQFLRWNYTGDYGGYLRYLHKMGRLKGAGDKIVNVTLVSGKYDRIDRFSFNMYVICDVLFDNGYHQRYAVSGYYNSRGESDFLGAVRPYNGENIYRSSPLDEYLIPVMNNSDFDRFAEKLRNLSPYPKELVHLLGFGVERSELEPDLKAKIVFDENRIIINNKLSGYEDQYIVHECVHACLHNLFYDLQKMGRNDISLYSPNDNECTRWTELQAEAVTRRYIMPGYELLEYIYSYGSSWEELRKLIDFVKDKYRVSRCMAKKRIYELGRKDVKGIYVYCENGYVDDYDTDLPNGYTYTLTRKQLLSIKSECFSDLISSGRFVYADGHIVLNDIRYIKQINGEIKLTEYARHHMSECCLPFKRVYGEYEYAYKYGELHKEKLKPITPESREITADMLKKIRTVSYETEDENIKLGSTPTTNPFGEAVKFHMKRCNITEEETAERSGMSVNTVSRMRRGYKVKLETVLPFCVALELEEPFRADLMKKAGVSFDPGNPAHRMYLTLLSVMPDANVFRINSVLKAMGFVPWTGEG